MNGVEAVDWEDLKKEFEFTPEEQAEIEAGTARLIAQVRAQRLAEIRRQRHLAPDAC